MRIVKRGAVEGDKIYTWECKKCISTIEAKESEGSYWSNDKTGNTVVFNCPVCGTDNICVDK